MQNTIANPINQLPDGCVFTVQQHTNPPAAAVRAEQQQAVDHHTYLRNINFICWPPLSYERQTQPEHQAFCYAEFIRTWPDTNTFALFHSDTLLILDGTSVGGFPVPSDCFYWNELRWRSF